MKQKQLSGLEQQVMHIIWQNKTCSVRDVLGKLQKKYAYTTVATILQRLNAKGLVNKKTQKEGHVYSARISKESYSKTIAQSFLKKFVDSFGDTAVASFAESIDNLPSKKRKYFLSILEEHDKNK
jgi:predicted transcriptional regulator